MRGSKRSDHLITQLKNLNLAFTIITAVNGNDLEDEELQGKVDANGCYARLGYEISLSLIGCFLSHNSTYETIVKSKLPWALVLEDDATIVNIDFDILNELMTANNEKPTIIQLFSRSSRLIRKNTLRDHEGEKKYVSFEFHRRLVGSGASAYLVNLNAATLAMKERIVNGAPDWPPWALNVKFIGVFPWMFYEDSVGSTIPDNEIKSRTFKLRRALTLLGIHYLIYNKKYDSFSSYIKEEILPYLLYLYWKIKGSKFYSDAPNSPQIL
jgi:glycosyl transferase family 25